MLRPIASFCVSRGLRFQDFIDISKRAFVDSAEDKLRKEKEPISTSKISVMTGIQRPEVSRISKNPEKIKSKDFIARVVGQWSSDKKFLDKKNKPKKLYYEGLNSDFSKLVQTVSSDLNPHTVRFELERLELVETDKGYATLLSPVYITSGDPKNTLRLGAYDVEDLLVALEENAFTSHDMPNLQARTEYDNIPDENIDVIKKWFMDAGSRFHDQARKFLSKFDRDISKKQSKSTGKNRIVLGTYSRVQVLQEELEVED